MDKSFEQYQRELEKYWIFSENYDQKQSEHVELEKSLLIWKNFISSTDSTIVLTSPEGQICFIGNPKQGHSDKSVQGKFLYDFVPDEEKRIILETIKQCIREKKSTCYEVRSISSDGKDFNYFDSTMWPLIENDKIVGIMVFSNDVTNIKEMETRLMHKNQMENLGMILGAISHEINNPLTILTLKIELLKKELLSEKTQKHFKDIEDSCKRISKTTNTVKNIFRPEGSDKSIFKIEDALEELSTLMKQRLISNKIDFSISIEDKNCHVKGSINSFLHCLLNLISNSSDAIHGKEGAWIKLNVRRLDKSVNITVTDSGVLSDEVKSKLLKINFTTKDRNMGSGLGLRICSRVIHDMQGSINFDNNSKNTKVVITLPLS